jgi:polysaccharide biosynthesis transport protein
LNQDLAFAPQGRAPAPRADLPALAPAAAAATSGRMPYQLPQLDLATLLRIVREWRWLILAAAVLGIVAGILVTLMTTPLYRTWVTLEANPPSVQVLEEGKELDDSNLANWDFIATQVGLLESRAVAERTAQDLNLASNPAVVGTGGTVEERMKAATSVVAGGIEVDTPEEGTLIRFSYTTPRPSSAPACSGVLKARPTPASSSSGRSPRPVRTSRRASASLPNMRRRRASSASAEAGPAAAAGLPKPAPRSRATALPR